jgi:hypothetical protein
MLDIIEEADVYMPRYRKSRTNDRRITGSDETPVKNDEMSLLSIVSISKMHGR